jgi:hypothetical protein
MARRALAKLFDWQKLKSPNGKKWYMVRGRPTGKRERYYFESEADAKKAVADRNRQIAAFGSQTTLPDSDRVMAAVHQDADALWKDTLSSNSFLPGLLREGDDLHHRKRTLRPGRRGIRSPVERQRVSLKSPPHFDERNHQKVSSQIRECSN